jgi:hypothetical protein
MTCQTYCMLAAVPSKCNRIVGTRSTPSRVQEKRSPVGENSMLSQRLFKLQCFHALHDYIVRILMFGCT